MFMLDQVVARWLYKRTKLSRERCHSVLECHKDALNSLHPSIPGNDGGDRCERAQGDGGKDGDRETHYEFACMEK